MIEENKYIEFLGEIEKNPDEEGSEHNVILNARVLKQQEGYKKEVYEATTSMVNKLCESITTRNQSFKKNKASEDTAAAAK